MFDIVTIGSITRDTFLEADYRIEKWLKTSSGKALVLPFGEKLEVRNLYATMGGNSANASVTFARQGLRTACFGKVGNDLAGREIEQQLRRERVTPLLGRTGERPTAFSVLLLEKGERTILGYHGASDTLSKKDIPWSKLKSDWWYLSLAGESDVLLRPLLAFARKHKIRVAFNPSGHHILHRRKEILASLKDISFLVVNTDEAALLTGIPYRKGNEKKVFTALDRMVPGIVAVTDGPKGVTVSDGTYRYAAGVYKEKRVMDRTGAGDAFGSGFVAGLLHHQIGPKTKDLRPAIQYAIRLASANATAGIERIGATEGVLTKRQFGEARWRRLPVAVTKI